MMQNWIVYDAKRLGSELPTDAPLHNKSAPISRQFGTHQNSFWLRGGHIYAAKN